MGNLSMVLSIVLAITWNVEGSHERINKDISAIIIDLNSQVLLHGENNYQILENKTILYLLHFSFL